jgi:hypothetical protein
MRNRFPAPTFLKQLQEVLQEEWHKIPLQIVQKLYESIPRRIAAVLKAKGGPTPYCDVTAERRNGGAIAEQWIGNHIPVTMNNSERVVAR